MEHERDVRDAPPEPLAESSEVVDQLVPVELRRLPRSSADLLIVAPGLRKLLRKARGVEQIAHAQAPPRRLVLVSGADAPERRPQLALPALLFAERLQLPVVGQDQVG